jgi:hypothetical protein
MTDDTLNRRLTAIAALLLTIFFIVGFLLPGAPPKADDSLREITHYLVHKRSSILAGDVFIGLAATFFLIFAAGLRRHLRGAGRTDDGLADTAFAGAVAGIVLLLIGAGLLNGIAFKGAGLGEPVRAWFDALNDIFFLSGFPLALFFGFAAWSGARSRAFPSWIAWLGWLTAIAQLLSGIGLFAKSGAFASGGAFAFVPPLIGTIWALAIAVILWRGAGKAATSGSA